MPVWPNCSVGTSVVAVWHGNTHMCIVYYNISSAHLTRLAHAIYNIIAGQMTDFEGVQCEADWKNALSIVLNAS